MVTFIKNNWSNQTGQLVQPAQFTAARAGKFPEGESTSSAAPSTPADNLSVAEVAQGAADYAAVNAANTEKAADAAVASPMPFQVFFATGQSSLDEAAQKTVSRQ